MCAMVDHFQATAFIEVGLLPAWKSRSLCRGKVVWSGGAVKLSAGVPWSAAAFDVMLHPDCIYRSAFSATVRRVHHSGRPLPIWRRWCPAASRRFVAERRFLQPVHA